MDMETRKQFEKQHGVVVVAHPGDKDLFTVVYTLDVPAADVQHACLGAMKIMQEQMQYETNPVVDGPVFEVIDFQGKRVVVDFNEVDANGQDGSMTEK